MMGRGWNAERGERQECCTGLTLSLSLFGITVFPCDNWQYAIVIPVFIAKGSIASDPASYRPVLV